MSLKPFIFTLLVLFLLTGMASASLIAPTTNSKGYNLWGTWWDMKGENGVRNGTLGGVGNNVTFLDGSGVTFLPISGTTSDLNMNGKNITNVLTINSTQVNVTTFNATNMAGNGSGIYSLNASNLTNPIAAVNGSALFGLNMSNQTTCTGNMTCTYNANGSVSLDVVSNITAIFNQIRNTSTVTAAVYPNGSMELTATTAASSNGSQYFSANGTFIVPAGVTRLWVTAWAGGGGGGGQWNSAPTVYTGGGGGESGEAVIRKLVHVIPAQSISVEIGAGGLGAVNENKNGTNGSHSRFGTNISLNGGERGYSGLDSGFGGMNGGNLSSRISGTRGTTNGWLTGGSPGGSGGISVAGKNGSDGVDFGDYSGGKGSVGDGGNHGGAGGGGAGYNGNGGDGTGTTHCVNVPANTGAGGGGDSASSAPDTGCNGGSGGVIIEW